MHSAVFNSQPLANFFALALSDPKAVLPQAGSQPHLDRLAEIQRRHLQQMEALWRSIAAHRDGGSGPPVVPTDADPRFKGSAWQSQPYFDLLRQAYLIGSSFLHELVDAADVDEKTQQRLRFLARQYTDAVSPANFWATNPEAVDLALRTNGDSIAAGLKNLLSDLAKGQVSTTDATAFEVGRDLAAAPGAVVFENELIQLIQYAPTTETVSDHPLLIVPPCINRFYVLDLQPDNSFVRHALSEGHTVFLISWRSAVPETAHLAWDDYLSLGVLAAVEVVREITQAAKVHALGFCIGGTLLGCAAAVLRGRGEDKLASLTLLTTMLDFADTGEIGLMVDEAMVAMREAAIGQGGILHGKELASVFSALRANDLVWSYVINNYLKGGSPPAFDILFWNQDSTDLPGPMYCWYLRNAYLENKIRVPGATVQGGVPVDLAKIDMPVYVLATREDHIVPWRTAFATTRLVGGEVRFVLGASGHIAGVINPPSRRKRSYWAGGELGIGPETWFRTANEIPGSWWTDWSRWLQQYPSRPVPAPATLGCRRFPALEPAPGRYATSRAASAGPLDPPEPLAASRAA